MKKKKFNLKKYADMHEDITVGGKDGTEVVVRTHIPYEQKLAFAQEFAARTIMTHDDSCAYDLYEMDTIEKWLIAKYYTNINTDEAGSREIADFFVNNEIEDAILEAIKRDYATTYDLSHRMRMSVFETYKDDKSITKAVRTSFGFLFNGEDITESMAKAEMTKDTIYNALSALREKEQEASEKINNGKLNVGGNLISFAKKKE